MVAVCKLVGMIMIFPSSIEEHLAGVARGEHCERLGRMQLGWIAPLALNFSPDLHTGAAKRPTLKKLLAFLISATERG